jgi:tetratricopeptide (TPR) repeat protein
MERARGLYARGAALLDLDDSVFKMDALHKLGDAAARVGRAREALAHFAEMLQIAWRLDLPSKGGAAHARIGRIHRTLGNYRLAHRHLQLGRLLFELAGDAPGMAACLDDVGRVHMLTGAVDDAKACHRTALELRDELEDDRGKALTLSWLGLCEAQQGDLVAAERCFRASLELSRQIEDVRGTAFGLMDLAGIDRELGRPDRARALLEEARALVGALAEPLVDAHLSVQIGECLLQASSPDEAERELASAVEVARVFGSRRLLSQALRAVGEAKLLRHQVVAARDHAEEALRLGEDIGLPGLIGAALRVMAMAEAAGAAGDPDRGGPRELFDRALDVLAEGGAELELSRTLSAYALMEDRTGRIEAARSLRDQAAGIRAKAWSHADVDLFGV